MLFGLARCGLPFSVDECCSDLNRYVVNHLLYFDSVKLKFFIVGGFAQSSKFVTHARSAPNGAEKVCQLQRTKPSTFVLILSSLGETRQATTIQKAFQRLLALSLVPLGADFGTCRHSPIGVTSVLQRQKIGPRTALGSGPVHMAPSLPGVNFASFPCRLAMSNFASSL